MNSKKTGPMQPRTIEALEILQRVAALGDYDSNIAGMVAEIIAEEEYGMKKTKRGTKDVDGFWFKGDNQRTVQVKAWTEKRLKDYQNNTFLRLKLENSPDDLLLLVVFSSKQAFAELYNGPTVDAGHIGNLNGKQVRIVKFGGKNKLQLSEELQLEMSALFEVAKKAPLIKAKKTK